MLLPEELLNNNHRMYTNTKRIFFLYKYGIAVPSIYKEVFSKIEELLDIDDSMDEEYIDETYAGRKYDAIRKYNKRGEHIFSIVKERAPDTTIKMLDKYLDMKNSLDLTWEVNLAVCVVICLLNKGYVFDFMFYPYGKSVDKTELFFAFETVPNFLIRT